MVQICDFSSLIFAGNTTVLLVLSITTDYWEYRSFDQGEIAKYVKATNAAKLITPYDTESYIQLRTVEDVIDHTQDYQLQEKLLYHPPLFVRMSFIRAPNSSVSQHVCRVQHEMTFFLQYGNLFRNCDELEADVRVRLGLYQNRPSRCVLWIDSDDMLAQELRHLDVSAGLCAVLCMVSVLFGFIAGGYGRFSNYTCLRAYKIASCLSLIAGFFLTLSIALFHGKCYIMRQMSLFPDHDIPLKGVLEKSRVYSYGWSFSLAWICVFFCYISSYIWLYKSHGSKSFIVNHLTRQPKKKVNPRRYFWRYRKLERHSYRIGTWSCHP